jgi:hypothetical protein
MYKISWLGPGKGAQKIHITDDFGVSTLCGQRPLDKSRKGVYVIDKLTKAPRCPICYMAMHKKKRVRSVPDWYLLTTRSHER